MQIIHIEISWSVSQKKQKILLPYEKLSACAKYSMIRSRKRLSFSNATNRLVAFVILSREVKSKKKKKATSKLS